MIEAHADTSIRMNLSASFAHLLLFECPECSAPILKVTRHSERTLELVDAASITVQCCCGWAGDLLGIQAKLHWVDR